MTVQYAIVETARPTMFAANLSSGIRFGTCETADQKQSVCIPTDLRGRHTYIIGRKGMTKSFFIEYMILEDISKGHGVSV